MTSGCRGTPYFRRYDRELVVLKPAISLKTSWGGYRRTTHHLHLAWRLISDTQEPHLNSVDAVVDMMMVRVHVCSSH